MRIALVTTTINVPKVLELYRAYSADVAMFVIGDKKTPHDDAAVLCKKLATSIAGCEYYSPARQVELGYACSPLIGWNTDSRRNIAVLEALKWGADVLVSVDDDMVPLGEDFFDFIERTMTQPFSGVCLGRGDSDSWLDVGSLTIPPARQRGLPIDAGPPNTHEFVTDVQIGVMQGIILGTPDTDAATTIANRLLVHTASDVLKSGFVVDPFTKCVFNSQITAFRRELAPAFAQFYKWQGRNTDIIASVLMRRIMRDRGLYTYYGPPTAYHARAPRDPQLDMNAEQWGLNKIRPLQDYLENTEVLRERAHWGTTRLLRALYEDMLTFDMLPKENVECALAWLDDCEKVL